MPLRPMFIVSEAGGGYPINSGPQSKALFVIYSYNPITYLLP